MKTTLEFLDAVKAKHGLTSDYQLAKQLDCTHSAISNYRSGRSRLGENEACKVAELLDIEAGFILSCIAAERSKNPRVKKAWEWTAQHLGGLAAVLAFLAIIPFHADILSALPHGAEGAPLLAFGGFTETAGIYIMRISDYSNWTLFLALAIMLLAAYPRRRKQ